MFRPKTLEDVVGMKSLKKKLTIAISSAKKRGDCLPHILLMGNQSGGVGKSAISEVIANEMGANFRPYVASAISKTSDILEIFLTIEEGDIIMLDEIHAMPNKKAQESIYTALEDYRLTVSREGNLPMTFDIPKFTLIGCTTEPGKLSQPFMSRFGIQHTLEKYTDEEIMGILKNNMVKLNISIDKNAMEKIAEASKGIPRIANRLLVLCRDYIEAKGGGRTIGEKEWEEIRLIEELDPNGLSKTELGYLKAINDNFGMKAVGLQSIASIINTNKDMLEKSIEPLLIERGLLVKTKRGRSLTQNGLKYLNKG